jgi:hypothetical protein
VRFKNLHRRTQNSDYQTGQVYTEEYCSSLSFWHASGFLKLQPNSGLDTRSSNGGSQHAGKQHLQFRFSVSLARWSIMIIAIYYYMLGSIPMQMCQMDFDFSVKYLQNLKLTSMSTKLVFRCYYNTNLWMLFSRGMESTFGYSMVSLKQMEDVGMSRNQISFLKWVKMVKSLIL